MRIDKILFIRSDRLGEFLLSLPAVKLAKINYPQSKIYLLAQKINIGLIKDVGFVDYFLEYREDTLGGYKGAFRLASILKKEGIDCIVVLNPKKEFHLAAFLAKVPLRVGYSRKWGFCLNRKIKDEKFLESKHEMEYNIDLVSLICKKVFIPQIELNIDSKESLNFLNKDLDINNKYFFIHPFTSHSLKKIEDDFWVGLISRLTKKFSKEIVMVGSEREKRESMQFDNKPQVRNLVGKLTLRNLAALLKYNCELFIGLDSGPLHLSNLLNVPTVGLFRTSNPRRWGYSGTSALTIRGKNAEEFINQIDAIIAFIGKISHLQR